MPNFYFILFLKRLDADEKLQYFQLPYIPCRMVSGNKLIEQYFILKTQTFKYTLFILSLDIFTQEIVIKTIKKHVHASPLPKLI
jgi:hypothetical protein